MFGRDAALQALSLRVARLEDDPDSLVNTVRTLIRMQAEAASREAAVRRRVGVLEAQVRELYERLVAIEDAPLLTDDAGAGEPISGRAVG